MSLSLKQDYIIFLVKLIPCKRILTDTRDAVYWYAHDFGNDHTVSILSLHFAIGT